MFEVWKRLQYGTHWYISIVAIKYHKFSSMGPKVPKLVYASHEGKEERGKTKAHTLILKLLTNREWALYGKIFNWGLAVLTEESEGYRMFEVHMLYLAWLWKKNRLDFIKVPTHWKYDPVPSLFSWNIQDPQGNRIHFQSVHCQLPSFAVWPLNYLLVRFVFA